MPLILAIEPDRRQSTKLTMLARNQLHADLLVTDSVEQALAALDEIVPDLILTSALLPSRDSIALADRLRELEAEGLQVQAMVIPALAVPGQRTRTPQRSGGAAVRGRNLSTPSAGAGCDPVVFGMQILARLDRAGVDRHAEPRTAISPPIAHAPAVTVCEPTPRPDDTTIEVFKMEIAHVKALPDQEPAAPDWTDILRAMRRDIDRARVEHDVRMALAIPLAPEPAEQPLPGLAAVAPVAVMPVVVAPQSPAPLEPVVATPEPARKKGRRRTPPQDEWGVFDPQQCGVSALIARVNGITGHTAGSAKKPA